ncbi:Nucleolar GTP-binding protein 2 [Pelomyxa schiedti]|nr:Nucleolar GTP-binding protein 2 [Pelomyxa schiedti]
MQPNSKNRPSFTGTRRYRSQNASTNPERPTPRGAGMRTRSDILRLNMYRGGKAIHDRNGKFIYQEHHSRDLPNARIAPDRRWFGNVHTVGQTELTTFRDELQKATNNPYTVLLKSRKLPWGLLSTEEKEATPHILDVESYAHTFGNKAQRKRAKLNFGDLDEYRVQAESSQGKYSDKGSDRNVKAVEEAKPAVRQLIYSKGQSHRIWGELWKVIDSSDVIVQVLDARDPMGTRCKYLEDMLKKDHRHKHVVLLLNKCDLIPKWATAEWVQVLSKEYPTIAFHASMTNPFGKGSLIQLLRQFAKLHQEERQISVGFVGYPNVGKSSIINTLRSKKVCKVAPRAGETKVWQYITLMKRIFLIDCPGVIYPSQDSESDIVLKGVVRVENLEDPTEHIKALLARVKPEYIQRTYDVPQWTDDVDFMSQLAVRSGKLLQKGEPDLGTVAKMILNDFQRGKIPYFVPPPIDPKRLQQLQQQPEVKSEAAKAETINAPEDGTTRIESVTVKKENADSATDSSTASAKQVSLDARPITVGENTSAEAVDLTQTTAKESEEESGQKKTRLKVDKAAVPIPVQNFNEVQPAFDFLDSDIIAPSNSASNLLPPTSESLTYSDSDYSDSDNDEIDWDQVKPKLLEDDDDDGDDGLVVLAEHKGGDDAVTEKELKSRKRKRKGQTGEDDPPADDSPIPPRVKRERVKETPKEPTKARKVKPDDEVSGSVPSTTPSEVEEPEEVDTPEDTTTTTSTTTSVSKPKAARKGKSTKKSWIETILEEDKPKKKSKGTATSMNLSEVITTGTLPTLSLGPAPEYWVTYAPPAKNEPEAEKKPVRLKGPKRTRKPAYAWDFSKPTKVRNVQSDMIEKDKKNRIGFHFYDVVNTKNKRQWTKWAREKPKSRRRNHQQ